MRRGLLSHPEPPEGGTVGGPRGGASYDPCVSRPRPIDRLTRERILDAAWALVARDGLESLSMRRIAAELQTGPMSLYNHVADKDDVLAGLLDRVFAQVETPEAGAWSEIAIGWASSLRSAISDNRQLVPLLARGLRPAALIELGLGFVMALERNGLDRTSAAGVSQTMGRFVAGSVLFEGAAQRQGQADRAAADRAFQLGLGALVHGLAKELGLPRPRGARM